MSWPTPSELISMLDGREPPAGQAEAAIGAAIAELEDRTGWSPFWAAADVERTLTVSKPSNSVIELPEPCQRIVSVKAGSDDIAHEIISDGKRIVGLRFDTVPYGQNVDVAVNGGAFAEVPGDVKLAVLLRAACLVGDSLIVSDAKSFSIGGLRYDMADATWFDKVCRRYSRVVL